MSDQIIANEECHIFAVGPVSRLCAVDVSNASDPPTVRFLSARISMLAPLVKLLISVAIERLPPTNKISPCAEG